MHERSQGQALSWGCSSQQKIHFSDLSVDWFDLRTSCRQPYWIHWSPISVGGGGGRFPQVGMPRPRGNQRDWQGYRWHLALYTTDRKGRIHLCTLYLQVFTKVLIDRSLHFFLPLIRSLRKYTVRVSWLHKYALQSTDKKLKHSRLEEYLAANADARTFVGALILPLMRCIVSNLLWLVSSCANLLMTYCSYY